MPSARADRERQILDIAATLFRERGYQGMRMDDLAATINLNKGTLYHYFPSKAELLYRIYRDTALEFLDRIRLHPADAPADELIALLIRDIATAIEERRDYVTVFFQEMHWLEKWLPADQYEEIDRLQSEFRNYVTGVIEKGVKAKVFRPVDATVAAFGLIGMVGWTYQWYTPAGRHTLQDVAGIFTDLTLGALGAVDGGTPAAKANSGRSAAKPRAAAKRKAAAKP
jgi:AcrR family transcriptional regulator